MKRGLFVVALVWGCGQNDGAKQSASRVEPASLPPTTASPPEADAAARATPALAATGMVCDGDGIHMWTEDDSTLATKAIRVVVGRDGKVYKTWEEIRSLSEPSTPPIAFPEGVAHVDASITNATSFLLQSEDDQLEVYRDGAWKRIRMPQPDLHWYKNAVELDGRWWLPSSHGLFRLTDAGEVEQVPVPPGVVRGLLPIGKDLWLIMTTQGLDYFIEFYKADAKGTFKRVAKVKDFTSGASRVALGGDRAAIFLDVGMRTGLVFVIDGGGKPVKVNEPDDPIEDLGSFDGAGRLWYRTKAALVARASDGTLTKYPLASKPMFQSEVMCHPVGGGFQRLPQPAGPLMGTLVLHVDGGDLAGADFVACESRYIGGSFCANAPQHASGKLDDFGRWRGEVPIGTYTFAVRRGSKWLVPDILPPGKANCEVAANGTCELKARAW